MRIATKMLGFDTPSLTKNSITPIAVNPINFEKMNLESKKNNQALPKYKVTDNFFKRPSFIV